MGYFVRTGTGTEESLGTARHWYARAITAGPMSMASLAIAEIKLGHGDVALKLLQDAVREELPGTERLLAMANIDRQLGEAPGPTLGRKVIERLVANGDRNAVGFWLFAATWGGAFDWLILQRCHQAGGVRWACKGWALC
ncbi:MAG: hypothetical protein ABJQ70_06130 [Roseobacter sp.]